MDVKAKRNDGNREYVTDLYTEYARWVAYSECANIPAVTDVRDGIKQLMLDAFAKYPVESEEFVAELKLKKLSKEVLKRCTRQIR